MLFAVRRNCKKTSLLTYSVKQMAVVILRMANGQWRSYHFSAISGYPNKVNQRIAVLLLSGALKSRRDLDLFPFVVLGHYQAVRSHNAAFGYQRQGL